MKKSLNPVQRDFFKNVAETAFSNPFSPEADALELRILPAPTKKLSAKKLLAGVIATIAAYFSQISRPETFNLHDYQGEDLKILEISWLYYQYRLHQKEFDLYIKDQQKVGSTPLPLPFAAQLIEEFTVTGFNTAQTAKYIALFFQLRRGFFFISRGVFGISSSMVQLRMHLWNNIFTFQPQWYLNFLCEQMEDFSTLLLGETGTGKSMVAQAIGCSGFIPFDLPKRKSKESFTSAFLAINLSQYSANLLESELFGHKKGAFTGAIDNHQGIFARCSIHGAVFIDEIGDIDMPTQVKLLTVIQERIFYPVGNHEKQRFAGRVIAATNRDIEKLRTSGQFRDDLYYRLCSDVIAIPSLRQRILEDPGELTILIQSILQKMLPKSAFDMAGQIEQLIRNNLPADYSWPGNVRELEQCIRRIFLTGIYHAETNSRSTADSRFAIDERSAQQVLQQYCQHLYEKHGSYEAVARITKLDRRTVKKHIVQVEE
jgi:two-component system, NtrC family, response regulator HydG